MDLSNLFTSSGSINSAILRRDWFLQSEQYKEILASSRDLDIFPGISISDRIRYLSGESTIEYCSTCGKPFIEFPHSQKRYALCKHKQSKQKYRGINHTIVKNKKERLFALVDSNQEMILSETEFNSQFSALPQTPNYNFAITDSNISLFHDILLKTKTIIPINIDDLVMRERTYLVKTNATERPVCKFCGNHPVAFIDRFKGYRNCCEKCRNKLGNETRKRNQNQIIESLIDTTKYDVLKLPGLVNQESLVIKCRKCGNTSEWMLHNGRIGELINKPLCRHCESSTSKPETELFEYCCNILGADKVIHNDRKAIYPKELDIHIPSKSIAIEFNGTYWHSDANEYVDECFNRKRHLEKTELCEKAGIRLFHVFELDWERKPLIVKSMIDNLLGVQKTRVYARKCEVLNVNADEARAFLEKNHLQGNCNASVRLGLYYHGELISLMTFSKPRFTKKYEWELVRFCSKLGYIVPGGAGKLLKHFEDTHHPTSMLSYADRSRSNGNLYIKLGFELDHKSKPDYKYVGKSGESVVNRISAQKHNLGRLLGEEKFNPNLSESQNMKNAGYWKIYDCGNLVFVKTY